MSQIAPGAEVALVKKLGCVSSFSNDGRHLCLTLLHLDDCAVVSHRTMAKDGYVAVVLGSKLSVNNKGVNKPQLVSFDKLGVTPRRILKEFRLNSEKDLSLLPVGHEVRSSIFRIGSKVDVCGLTKGRGFSGGRKRWNFRGLRATHGVSLTHNSIGSTGQRKYPSKVFKGKKMPGRYGHEQVTIQSLKVIEIDSDRNLVAVLGAVPGPTGSYLCLRRAIKG